MCPKHTHYDPPLFNLLRSVGPGRQMLGCLSLLVLFSAAMLQTVVTFFLCMVFSVGATSLVLQQQLSLFYTFYIRSLAVARFDRWLYL
jgi:hypothetical protein